MRTNILIYSFLLLLGSCHLKSKKDVLIGQLKEVAKISTTEMIVEKISKATKTFRPIT